MKSFRKKPTKLGSLSILELKTQVFTFLDAEKLFDVVDISLSGKSEEADFMIIASGSSSRQVLSVSEKLTTKLKNDHGIRCRVEGLDAALWVLIDAGDLIIHIFRPDVRDYYQLEKMWKMTPKKNLDA